jgi:uncharacterized membrane protein YccC
LEAVAMYPQYKIVPAAVAVLFGFAVSMPDVDGFHGHALEEIVGAPVGTTTSAVINKMSVERPSVKRRQ